MTSLLLAVASVWAAEPDALLYVARPAATPEGDVRDVVLEPSEGARLGTVSRTPTGAHVAAWPDGSARRGGVRARVQGRDGVWYDAGSVNIVSSRTMDPVIVGDVQAGASEARVRFPGGARIAPHARLVRVSEGSVLDAIPSDDALDVRLKLGPDRTARVVAVALLDTRTPGAMPKVALLRIHARTELAFPAEAGTTAVVRVGRRTLGPFSAGTDGRIVAPVEVVPADTTWELQATDLAGNVQRTSGPLPSRSSPVLIGIDPANPSEDSAWLFGWTPGGTPLATVPSCVGDGGVRPTPIPVEDGVWRVRYPGATGAVECASATSSASMRAARQEPTPARVALIVRPAQVSVDFPYAQVEAAVIDSRGARMPPSGLQLHGLDGAVLGLVMESADALAVEVDARPVARDGRFTVEATWTASSSRDIPARLDAEAWRDADTIRVRAGVRDARGLPVEGAVVGFDGGSGTRSSTTDARGDAWIDLAAGADPLVRVTVGGLTHRVRPRTSPPPATVRGPDLRARNEVPIVAGRALAIELPSPPGVVRLGDRVQLRARVRDASGGVLTDVVPRLSATVGRVDAPVLIDDTWVAAWSDDEEAVLGEVRVRATVGTEGSLAPIAEARWSVQPPPVRGSVAVLAGAALNAGDVTPMFGGTLQTTVPWLPELLSLRVGVTGQAYEAAARGATDATSAEVSARLLPVDLGIAAGRRDGRRSLDAYVSVVLAPYQVRVRYGDQVTLTGLGVSDAGVALGGSVGWRTGRTELYGEVRYAVYGASGPLLSFERPFGGPSACLGYRFPW
jgi:hypothetical protein